MSAEHDEIGEYLAANEEAAFARVLAIKKRMADLERDLNVANADHREAMRVRMLYDMRRAHD